MSADRPALEVCPGQAACADTKKGGSQIFEYRFVWGHWGNLSVRAVQLGAIYENAEMSECDVRKTGLL